MRYKIVTCILLLLCLSTPPSRIFAQTYWNRHTSLITWRLPLPGEYKVYYVDFDRDGDPDMIRTMINDSIPVIWIDDDDDMRSGDMEGDTMMF